MISLEKDEQILGMNGFFHEHLKNHERILVMNGFLP
jgi:hypothetical protein